MLQRAQRVLSSPRHRLRALRARDDRLTGPRERREGAPTRVGAGIYHGVLANYLGVHQNSVHLCLVSCARVATLTCALRRCALRDCVVRRIYVVTKYMPIRSVNMYVCVCVPSNTRS